jgi:hypothetical protein
MKKAFIGLVGFFLTVPYAHAGNLVVSSINAPSALPAGVQPTVNPALLVPGTLGALSIVSGTFSYSSSVYASSSTVHTHRSGDSFSLSSTSSVDPSGLMPMGYLYLTVSGADVRNAVGIEAYVTNPYNGALTALPGSGMVVSGSSGGGIPLVTKPLSLCSGVNPYMVISASNPVGACRVTLNVLAITNAGVNTINLPAARYVIEVRYADGSRKQSILNAVSGGMVGSVGIYGMSSGGSSF